MNLYDAMTRRARENIAAGKKLRATFGIMALIAAAGVMAFQMYNGLVDPSPDALAWASFGWFVPLGLGVAGLFYDDRKTFAIFGIFSFLVFGLPLILISIELLGFL